MPQVPTISRYQLKKRVEDKRPFVLIEVLTADKFAQGHLPGAINLPPYQVEDLAAESIPDNNSEIVVYSASPACQASVNTARVLIEAGYTNVRRYAGGKLEWMNARLPIEGDMASVGVKKGVEDSRERERGAA